MQFGKLPARSDPRTLRLGSYLTPALRPPPPSYSVLPRVQAGAKLKSISKLYPMDGNMDHSDCVAAALAHALTTWCGMTGKRRIPGAPKVLSTYFSLTGGPDSGLVEIDTLNVFRNKGLFGEKILAYVYVHPGNLVHVKTAISLFGCLLIGFETTDETIPQFHARQPWTPGRKNGEGHAVLLTGYDDAGVTALTWGSSQKGSWSWLSQMGDEGYAVLPLESSLDGFSPGFNLAQLQADLQQVEG